MKKKINLAMVCICMFVLLTGCSNAASPVKTFCSALNKLDYTAMCGCYEEEMMTEEDFTMMYDEFAELGLEEAFAANAKAIKCTVGKPVVDPDDDESASVNVVIKYNDYSTGIKTALDTFYKEYFEDEEDVVDETRLAELLKEHYTNDTPAVKEETVVFYMEKLENKKWVISYDYDMLDRIANAISGNLMDMWYDYDYDYDDADYDDADFDEDYDLEVDEDGNIIGFTERPKWYEEMSDEEIDEVLSANGIERTEDTDLSDYDYLFEDEDDELDWEDDEDWDDDWDDEEADLYDEYMDRIFNVESSGALMIKNYTLADVDEDDDYYILTGDVYDVDIYSEWLSIINSVPDFAGTYPDIYEDLDDGLYCEEMDVYIPKDLAVSGMWPSGSGISGLMNLINSGHAIVYTGEMDDEAEAVYDSSL